jgi:hypothetical protein
MVEIKTHSSPIRESDITNFEKNNALKLPEDYKNFMLQYNGGYPMPNSFKIKKYGASMMDCFYGINAKTDIRDMEYNKKIYKKRVPKEFLIIGADQLGNLILIGIKDKYINKIYFWWHEEESDTDEPVYTNIYMIADNFNTFLNSLYVTEEKKTEVLGQIFKSGDNKKIEELINSGWDINSPLESGMRAIEFAVILKNNEILKLLISKGSELKGALYKSLTNNNLEAEKILLEAGANPDEIIGDNSLLYESIIFENIPFVKILLSYTSNINVKNSAGRTPLVVARKKFKLGNKEMQEVIDLLISKGATE